MGNAVVGVLQLIFYVYLFTLCVNLYILTLVDASYPYKSSREDDVIILSTQFLYQVIKNAPLAIFNAIRTV